MPSWRCKVVQVRAACSAGCAGARSVPEWEFEQPSRGVKRPRIEGRDDRAHQFEVICPSPN
jgi:hypothetical protein